MAAVALVAATVVPMHAAVGQAGSAAVPVVRVPFPQEDGTLTPYTFELGYPLMTLVYDTLLWRDADGVPQPWLAKSVETSPDGRTVTIRLAEGAEWHDGQKLTSADVAFTFAYVAAHPHPRFSGEVTMVERVDTPDPTTAVVSLRQPSAGFADQPLADLPILPKHLWSSLPRSKPAPDGLPVGSGPYRLVEHVVGTRYRFAANPGYFRGPPSVAAIEVPIIKTADDTVHALERREVDMVPESLPPELATRVDELGIRVQEGTSYLGTVLLFNVRAPPFDRLEVRQAVANALDVRQIAGAVGHAIPAEHGYLHPASPFAPAEVLRRTDPVAARAVLAGLGVPVTIGVPENDPTKAEAGRRVVQALRGVGAMAELKTLPRKEQAHAVGEDGSAPSFQAAISVAPPLASYDPSFLARLFGSDPKVAPFNYSGYRSAAFDAAALRIASTADPAARKAVTAEALKVLEADAPVVPLFFVGGAFSFRPAVYDGWVYVKGSGILDKRSFVEGHSSPTLTTAPVVRAKDPGSGLEGSGGGSGRSSFSIIVIILLGLAGLLAFGTLIVKVRDR